MKTGNEIRQAFLDYFEREGHTVVSSSPVVPAEDPTLLFTNAGMNQFKRVFTGEEARPYRRATSSQKCIRVSGKHNDLENVGRTARHHTFFEMLGNFSFGDYFKQEAVDLAWRFLTEDMGLEKDRLYATIYTEDDEAEQVWRQASDLEPRRIYRLGKKDNYWSMGDTGPQGPCSEILYDLAPTKDTDPGAIDPTDGERFLEIWNLVFMQFEAKADGEVVPLPRPSIDTGMGLERLASILQGVESNYDTDLLRHLLDAVAGLSGVPYDEGEAGMSHRVVADHVRALTFAITDGVIPANDGRGYVLRRLLRRAARHGRKLGIHDPFIWRLVPTLVEDFQGAYPDIATASDRVQLVIRTEEERFGETLDQGIDRFEELAGQVTGAGKTVVPGREAFVLYDTYGFPFDLTRVMAEERGLEVDEAGFEAALAEQQERSRADRAERGTGRDEAALEAADGLPADVGRAFVGYDPEQWDVRTELQALFEEDFTPVERLGQGERGFAVLAQTPFYAESGGQTPDTGEIEGDGFLLGVERVDRKGGVIFHRVIGTAGIAVPGPVETRIDAERRVRLMRNHTATHLMHAALREVLGTHVQQAGSLVEADRLRFDFSHYSGVSDEEQTEVIRWVNRGIWANTEVQTTEMPYQEALDKGALAFFGDKYGDVVRVVEIPGWSTELCGGTHVGRTGEIGFFRLEEEGSISSGVRRVEAVTAQDAVRSDLEVHETLQRLQDVAGASEKDLLNRISAIIEENKTLRRDLERTAVQQGMNQVDKILQRGEDVAGVTVASGRVEAADAGTLRTLADAVRGKLSSGIGVLGAEQDGKAMFICVVTEDLVTAGWKAGPIVNGVAAVTGGRGGGRPDLAQAGGPEADRLDEALAVVNDIVRANAPGGD